MTFRRFMESLTVVSALVACSDDDTIVSLNVTVDDSVPVFDRLHVAITQGSRSHVSELAPPTETSSGGNAAVSLIKRNFFQRISLADGWKQANALVEVEARHVDGTPFEPPLIDQTSVEIQPQGVVAAFVELGTMPSGSGGTDGGGGHAGGEGGDGGVSGSEGAAGSDGGVSGSSAGAAGSNGVAGSGGEHG